MVTTQYLFIGRHTKFTSIQAKSTLYTLQLPLFVWLTVLQKITLYFTCFFTHNNVNLPVKRAKLPISLYDNNCQKTMIQNYYYPHSSHNQLVEVALDNYEPTTAEVEVFLRGDSMSLRKKKNVVQDTLKPSEAMRKVAGRNWMRRAEDSAMVLNHRGLRVYPAKTIVKKIT